VACDGTNCAIPRGHNGKRDAGCYQQGTFQPDADWRWMGSATMDKVGTLLLGYSVSSSSVVPSIRFAYRDPATRWVH